MNTSLVIGAGGQDGTLLAELLVQRGDRVVGVAREKTWCATGGPWDPVDILHAGEVAELVRETQPAECYYLPAFHHSAEDGGLRLDDAALFTKSHAVHVQGLLHLLHAVAEHSPATRLFYAASSHVFGTPAGQPQDEATPLNPENIYGITKTMGILCCRYFRRERGVFAATGILYNHESPLRPVKFLSQKIVRGVLAFQRNPAKKLVLGDLNAVVDWGYAGDYVEAMARILGQATAQDFVVATGEPHTVGEFLQIACELAGVDWRECVETNPGLLRKKPVVLIGNSRRLRQATGWAPQVSFRELIALMLTAARACGSEGEA